MCFYTNKTKVKKATKDITCYKYVSIDTNDMFQHFETDIDIPLMPIHNYNSGFRYKLGRIHKIPTSEKSIFHKGAIGRTLRCSKVHGGAFHSSKNIQFFNISSSGFARFRVRVVCTIPKGSKYCENSYGEYISNSIRIDYISLELKDWVEQHWNKSRIDYDKFIKLCNRADSKLQVTSI